MIDDHELGRTDDIAGVIIGRDREKFNDKCVVQVVQRALGEVAESECIFEFAFAGAVEIRDLGDQGVGARRILDRDRQRVQAYADGEEVPVAKGTSTVLEFEHEGDGIDLVLVKGLSTDRLERELGML